MPISGDEFELGQIEPTLFILQILEEAFPNALDQSDLVQAAAIQGREMSLEQLKDTLHVFVESDKVEAKTIKDVIYYRYKKRSLGFRSEKR